MCVRPETVVFRVFSLHDESPILVLDDPSIPFPWRPEGQDDLCCCTEYFGSGIFVLGPDLHEIGWEAVSRMGFDSWDLNTWSAFYLGCSQIYKYARSWWPSWERSFHALCFKAFCCREQMPVKTWKNALFRPVRLPYVPWSVKTPPNWCDNVTPLGIYVVRWWTTSIDEWASLVLGI